MSGELQNRKMERDSSNYARKKQEGIKIVQIKPATMSQN